MIDVFTKKVIISLIMDIELSLIKFINHYTKHNRDDNGEKYSEDQANLIENLVLLTNK